MKPDWDEIKAEYIGGGISQRDLAEAHGVSYRTLRDRAKKEGWVNLRQETGEKTAQKMSETISDVKMRKINKIIEQLLNQTSIASKQLRKKPTTVRETQVLDDGTERVTVRIDYEDGPVVDKQGLRLLAQTVKELDEILRKQRLEAQGGAEQNAVTVIFEAREDLSE